MFNSGFRPAVNAGLSVSRVGGSAQIKAMKKIAGTIRIDLHSTESWQHLHSLDQILMMQQKKACTG